MGPPGAGKGTQAKRLAGKFGMAHLSSGDIFRAERASGSALGEKLAQYMDAGQLVPDETVVAVMAKAVAEHQGGGIILDGFPRTVPQARALDAQLDRLGKPLQVVLVIAVRDDEIVRRITGRRSCPNCGQAYHAESLPPRQEGICDACGSSLVQREDDGEQTVRQRLAAYERQTRPVIDYYRGRAQVEVKQVDGNAPPDAVTAALVRALGSSGACGVGHEAWRSG
jgi:adenylate kinase